eukprot:1769239-Pyramimonas_sp.AAC.1
MAWHAMRTVENIMLSHVILHRGIAHYSVAWCIMVSQVIVQHGVVALHSSWPISWRQLTGRSVDESGGGGMRNEEEAGGHT